MSWSQVNCFSHILAKATQSLAYEIEICTPMTIHLSKPYNVNQKAIERILTIVNAVAIIK